MFADLAAKKKKKPKKKTEATEDGDAEKPAADGDDIDLGSLKKKVSMPCSK